MAPTASDPGRDAALPFSRIAFLGFGLVGGSIAMALRAHARTAQPGEAPFELDLRAWTPDGHGPGVALRSGLLDAAPAEAAAALEGTDLVVLAGPPLAILDQLDALAGPWRDALGDALVTDVGSTKAVICATAAALGLRFVGGHPMAGREATGIEAASAALFVDRPWAVVSLTAGDQESADVEAIAALARATGARPVRIDADAHDAAVATISHVPLLTSVALVEAMTADSAWREGAARELAASGWRDTTRLAGGSPDMGAGILATNAVEVAMRLHAVRDALDRWIAELERGAAPDPERLRDRLEAARSVLRAGPNP